MSTALLDLLHADPSLPPHQKPACRVCGYEAHSLLQHLFENHDLSPEKYDELHPSAPLVSSALVASYKEASGKSPKRIPASSEGLRVSFAGVAFSVNADVPAEACLPMPEHYAVPTRGALAADVQSLAIALSRRRSVWVSGPQGTGKDAAPSAISALTRMPGKLLQVVPDTDIQSWLFARSFINGETVWEEGDLLKALRDGYVTSTGRRVPYMIVLSDIDRAQRAQLEYLRLVLDSIQGRVVGPNGSTHTVLPGTVIVATANSTGGGDATGRYVSVNVVDTSILDRFNRAVIFHTMDPEDEEPVIRAKYPLLAARMPNAIPAMMKACTAVRAAVVAQKVLCDFSHRALCAWAECAEDLLEGLPEADRKDGAKLLRRAAQAVLDKLPNDETRSDVRTLMDPHLTGGIVDEGDTSHIKKSPLKAKK